MDVGSIRLSRLRHELLALVPKRWGLRDLRPEVLRLVGRVWDKFGCFLRRLLLRAWKNRRQHIVTGFFAVLVWCMSISEWISSYSFLHNIWRLLLLVAAIRVVQSSAIWTWVTTNLGLLPAHLHILSCTVLRKSNNWLSLIIINNCVVLA